MHIVVVEVRATHLYRMSTHHNQLEFLVSSAAPVDATIQTLSQPRRVTKRMLPAVPALLPADDQPLRIATIAAWLGVADKTVRRRIDSGEIRSVKMGGLRVILRRDFKAYWEKLNPTGGSDV